MTLFVELHLKKLDVHLNQIQMAMVNFEEYLLDQNFSIVIGEN